MWGVRVSVGEGLCYVALTHPPRHRHLTASLTWWFIRLVHVPKKLPATQCHANDHKGSAIMTLCICTLCVFRRWCSMHGGLGRGYRWAWWFRWVWFSLWSYLPIESNIRVVM